MANSSVTTQALPDWWEREKRRRQLRILLFLTVVLGLIGHHYWVSYVGIVQVDGIHFDSTNYIAFIRQEERPRQNKKGTDTVITLYAIRADGSGLQALTRADDNSNKSAPAWTSDGKKILYASNKNDSRATQIYLLGEGEPKQLIYGTGNKFSPVQSPGSDSKVAFVTQGAIKTVNLNGTEVEQQIPTPHRDHESGETETPEAIEPQGPFLNALFSSDGKGIAGVQDISGDEHHISPTSTTLGDQVARVLPPGATKAHVLDMGREVSLAWEPTGSRLACAFAELQVEENKQTILVSGIRVWSFEKPNKPVSKMLFASKGFSLVPKNISWSVDGSKIAFEGWLLKGEGIRELGGLVVIDAKSEAFSVDANNVNAVRFMVAATANGKPQHPKWSPDGSRLLFEQTRPDGGNDLWIINADGTNLLNLTKGVGNNIEAVWAPSKVAQK